MAENIYEVFFSLNILLIVVNNFCIVNAQITYNGYNLALTTVPENIPANTQTLVLSVNQLTTIPAGSLSNLTQLTFLRLDNNKLTTFPDIQSVSSTLVTLHLQYNQITYIDPLFLNALVKIVTLHLFWNTGLGSFPDVSGPGNSLSVLLLGVCGIGNFPGMTSMRNLTKLQLTGNTIAEIKANSLIGLDSLQILELNKLLLTEVPDLREVTDTLVELNLDGIVSIQEVEQSRFAQLRNLLRLKVPNMLITKIPTLCPRVLNTLVITATGSPLHLCSCENVWLKQAVEKGGATVIANNVTCGATLWAAMTTAQLLAICQPLVVPGMYVWLHAQVPAYNLMSQFK